MAYKVRINNDKEYLIKDGFVLKDEYNETLDSGTLNFKLFNGELEAESFDKIEIFDTENKISKKTMLIDSGDDEVYSFDNESNDHFYTLSTFSQTKELERITLPNCSVTQPIITGLPKKTVWDEIRKYCSLYMPKIKVYDAQSRFVYVTKYRIDDAIRTKFNSIVCPEFQWNNPTLREVLNDLMSTANCIALIRDNVLTYFDLTETGSEIDTSKLNYSKKSFGSNDYVGELTIAMKNAIGKNKTIVCEKKSLRTSSGMFNTNDAIFITQHPIYNIVSCKVSYYYSYKHYVDHHGYASEEPAVIYRKEVDITQFIKENDIYEIANNGRYDGSDIQTALGYKHYLLNYKRGGNTIEGWGRLTRFSPLSSNYVPTIGWIAEIIGMAEPEDTIVLAWGNGFTSRTFGGKEDIAGIHVDLTYETVSEHAMHVGKYLPSKHPENRIFDNQAYSYVDVNHQSIFEYAKVNRLGNKITEIQGVYFNESDIPDLGDKIGDEILFSREIEYCDEQFNFKGFLIKNYILKDYFTGVQAKRRSWQLAKDEEALGRNEIIKEYLEFSFKKKDDLIDINTSIDIIKFANAVNTYSAGASIKYALIRSYAENINGEGYVVYPNDSSMFQLDLDKAIQGMSICFNFGAMDNVSVDYYLEYNSNDNAYFNNLYKYCNDLGEFDSLSIVFSNSINPSDGDFVWEGSNHVYWMDYEDECEAKMLEILNKVIIKPKIKNSAITQNMKIEPSFYKDNREILQISCQFEYCSDTPNIIVKPRFLELCQIYNDNAHSNSSIKVYASTTEKYALTDTIAKGNLVTSVPTAIKVSDLSAIITLSSGLPSGFKSWAICDNDGNILIAVNTEVYSYVYLNALYSRDDKIYSDFQNMRKIGDLTSTQAQLDNAYNNLTLRNPSNVRISRRRNVNSLINITPENFKEDDVSEDDVSEGYQEE